MSHILNMPELSENKDVVVSGYGIMQPRVGLNINCSLKSKFTKLFAGYAGIDAYSNAVSDVYQDIFKEGIFTGKGIYDLEIFNKVLENSIPENTVLSHDLLEGSYLRCGLLTDIYFMDGYPVKYNSSYLRLHRWIRGDWQIIYWLKKKIKGGAKNPLNSVSKFKIFDNLRRSLLEIGQVGLLILSILVNNPVNLILQGLVIFISFIQIIIGVINSVVFKKSYIEKQKMFTPVIDGIKGDIYRCIINMAFLSHKAWFSLNAIIKTLYRMFISHEYLLEWVTASDAEKNTDNNLSGYLKNMCVNIILGLGLIILSRFNILLILIGALWIAGPFIAFVISKEESKEKVYLTQDDIALLKDVAFDTSKYFLDFMNEENNFLPPDNYQENRKEKIAYRTSTTNIGLGMLSIISSADLGFIEKKEALDIIGKILEKISYLQKWNGHLYNWYNTKTLEPIIPRYVSSVDNGNLIGYLYVLKQAMLEYADEENINITRSINIVDKVIEQTDFSYLYNYKNNLFSIGYDVETNALTDSYYDLLESEARQTSFIAIANKQVPQKHWNNLSRTLTRNFGYKGMVSWAGTAFEYLMPNINMPTYKTSLLDESARFMLLSQKKYADKLGIPWGISESAFSLQDLNLNYQYKAFGVPWLGLKRGLAQDVVVAPYASILALNFEPREVINNMKLLKKEGVYGKYGFFESVDYTPSRLRNGERKDVVRTYMAHHQGLILLSINNFLNNNIMQKRFMRNPSIKSANVLLQERMPEKMIVTKEKKEKIDTLKYVETGEYEQRVYNKIGRSELPISNVLSNENYTIYMDQFGQGFSKHNDIYLNKYRKTNESFNGICFYIKDVKNKNLWTNTLKPNISTPSKYIVNFAPDRNKYLRTDGLIDTITKITISPDDDVEIRQIELKNNSNEEVYLEITSYFEPILSRIDDHIAHPAFCNLFLSYEYIEELNGIMIKRRSRDKSKNDKYALVLFFPDEDILGDYEYEIDKTKFIGRDRSILNPIALESEKILQKQMNMTLNPIVALRRTIKIESNKSKKLNLILLFSENREDIIKTAEKYNSKDAVNRIFSLSRAKSIIEARYSNLKAKQINTFQKIAGYLLNSNLIRNFNIKNIDCKNKSQCDLWKFGISGDNPILLVKIKYVNDVETVKELLKAHEYLRLKNVVFDLVILNEEKNSYEKYVNEALLSAVLSSNSSYLLNSFGGIFILDSNNLKKEEKDLLQLVSSMIFDAHRGGIEEQIDELEDDIKGELPNYVLEKEKRELYKEYNNDLLALPELKYFNELGGFLENGKEYIIKLNKETKTPMPWSNILVNKQFGTLVTAAGGGYTWNKNSRENRLTTWYNETIEDIPAEVIYIKDKEEKTSWSITLNPKSNSQDYIAKFGFGYSEFINSNLGISTNLNIFVPQNDDVKINKLNIKNNMSYKRSLKIVYYLNLSLGMDIAKHAEYINIEKDETFNLIYLKNIFKNEFKDEFAYVSCSEKISGYTGSKEEFFGLGDISNPQGLNLINFSNQNSIGQSNIIAIEIDTEIDANESKDISIILGSTTSKEVAKDVAYKYYKISNCNKELENTKEFWNEHLNVLQVKTPVESTNILLNAWLLYQVISSRLWGRTGYYQSGGAFGFRDQLQDVLGIIYVLPEQVRAQIIEHAKHQFYEGDVEHWWHKESKKGIRTRFSDDLLWLAYVVEEYIRITDDTDILKEEVSYLDGDKLLDNEDEKYQETKESNIKGSIYEHVVKAIDRSLELGDKGLPFMGSGDWNDGMNTVGNKGNGQSVWLGFFLFDILNKILPICEMMCDKERIEIYKLKKEQLKNALNINAWDGRWFKRAFFDDGTPLGSIENDECRIDAISQSWACISNAADNDKKYICMESLENQLIDKENSIIKLLDPPFNNTKLEPGYIKSYMPGVRENGGQYTHAAIWAIIAFCSLGLGEKAHEYFKMINPIENARTKEAANKYKVEPYVMAADVYSVGNLAGRGGWTWYTGSGSWMYKAGIENILGFNKKGNILTINPCIPAQWDEYSIRYKYEQTIYNIEVKNPNHKNTGVEEIYIDNIRSFKNEIELINDNNVHNIKLIM